MLRRSLPSNSLESVQVFEQRHCHTIFQADFAKNVVRDLSASLDHLELLRLGFHQFDQVVQRANAVMNCGLTGR